MWIYTLMCVIILDSAAMNASACSSWSPLSSCNRSCGGGEKTRKCNHGSHTEIASCNQFCLNGYSYNGGCHCSSWRPGHCCEGCSKSEIAHCKPGMYECGGSPDGIRCTDCYLPYKPGGYNNSCVRKPCNENNGDCAHWCTTVSGLTKCTCRDGYQLSPDEYSCIDINECLTETARHCEQQCVNTIGSFKCACDNGYRLNPDGSTCDDIDECNIENGGCAHVCENIPGSYGCTCNNGYTLDEGAHQCKESESTSRQLETSTYSTADISPITPSKYSETSIVLTTTITPEASTTFGSTSSLTATQMHTTLATDSALSANNDGTGSPALAVGLGVSVGILLFVGGAIVIVVLKRRGILQCSRNTENNKPSEKETSFREYKTYGKNNEDNVAHHNYLILEKCEQSISNNAEHYTKSNAVNMEDNYNTIHETGEPYEHVKDESSDYDHIINALTSGSGAKKTDNVYNKLKIDRQGDNVHRHGHSVVQSSEDDYNTTSAVMSFGKDDVSDYNHIPHTAYKAATTDNDIKGNKGGDYDAINNMKFKVAQSDSSDYAHVNKDRIK